MASVSSANDVGQTGKAIFEYTLLKTEQQSKESHYNILTHETYNILLEQLKEAKVAAKRTTLQYRRLRRFDVISVDGIEKLIAKSTEDGEIRYYLCVDEIYDALEAIHVPLGHCGRDKIKKQSSKKFANLTSDMINLYLSMCETCKWKKKDKKSVAKCKRPPRSQFNQCCQIDVIQVQEPACDDKHKFMLIYQENATKFVQLRPLQNRSSSECANHLLQIFATFRPAENIASDMERTFLNAIIEELARSWPNELGISVTESSRTYNANRRDISTIKTLLNNWIAENNACKWSEGLCFVQLTFNMSWHAEIKCTPYEAIFGVCPNSKRGDVSETPCIDQSLTNFSTQEWQNSEDSQDNGRANGKMKPMDISSGSDTRILPIAFKSEVPSS